MPTTSRIRSAGLSGADLDGLRTAVDAGRRPKVVFTAAAGQIAGQQGQVVRLDDPAADEWVVVRFGRDELPFAPGDLQLAPKATRKRAPAVPDSAVQNSAVQNKAAAVAPTVPQQLPVPDGAVAATAPVATGARATAPLARQPIAAAPPATPPAAPEKSPANQPPSAGAGKQPATPAAAKPPADPAEAPISSPTPSSGTAAASKPNRRPARKSPELTVTLGHHEGRWTIQAAKGARTLVKPTSVRPADALKMVALLDAPGVTDVVAEIVEAARAEAEQVADRLRRELAEVEATLADLED